MELHIRMFPNAWSCWDGLNTWTGYDIFEDGETRFWIHIRRTDEPDRFLSIWTVRNILLS